MSLVTENSTVKVHYTGKLLDNTVFDSSLNNEPISATLGQGLLIAGFEKGLIGMSVGETKTVTIPFAEAYGPVLEERIQEVERQYVPETVEIGQMLTAQTEGGPINVTVVDMNDTTVTLDGNHPLAGQDLIFELEVIEVQ
jgi:FKBP-type peptidyl-prolyl cis-trans isomerase 2